MKVAVVIALALAQQVGAELPPLKLSTVDGKELDLNALSREGKLVALVSWSESCPSGKPTRDPLRKLGGSFAKDVRVTLVAVNSYGDPAEEVARQAQGFRIPFVHDADQAAARALGARRVNAAYVYKNGKLFWHGGLSPSGAELKRAIDAALKGAAAPPSGGRFMG